MSEHSEMHNELMQHLVVKYENLKQGKSNSFLDEQEFEQLIDYFDQLEKWSDALEAAELGAVQYPYSSSIKLRWADMLIGNRSFHQALTILHEVELLDPQELDLYILKTDVYLALDQPEKALQLLETVKDQFTGESRIELLYELADVYEDYEAFDEVWNCLKMILEQDPTQDEALYKICFWTDFTNKNEESILLHQNIINEEPYSEVAWFNLGAAYQGLKLYEKAIDAYQYVIAIDDKFEFAYRNMGEAYIRLRRYKNAIEVLERCLEISMPEDIIYEAIGTCYEKLKQNTLARLYYRKAIHLDNSLHKVHYKIAYTYLIEKKWEMAQRVLETCLKFDRFNPDYNLAMGECYMQLSEIEEAIKYLAIAVRERPRNTKMWEAYLRSLYYGEHYEEALFHLDKVQQTLGRKAIWKYITSAIQIAMGYQKEGLLSLEQALQEAPKLVKRFIMFDPTLLQYKKVAALITQYKKST